MRSNCIFGIKQEHVVGRCRLRCDINVLIFIYGYVTFNLSLIMESSCLLVQVQCFGAANLSTKSTIFSSWVKHYLLVIYSGRF